MYFENQCKKISVSFIGISTLGKYTNKNKNTCIEKISHHLIYLLIIQKSQNIWAIFQSFHLCTFILFDHVRAKGEKHE